MSHPNGTRIFIEDLQPSHWIAGAYSISNAQLGRTKQDKPFLKCLIGDRTGMLPGRMWSIEQWQFERLPTEGFVEIEAETQPYQGELQLILRSIEPIEPTDEQLRELLPCSERDPEEMFAEVVALLGSLEHPASKALAQAYLEDERLISAFKRAPAAKVMHHAYLGGLLFHTLQLMKLADMVCPLYPGINRDIVMLGVFIHDIAKTRELVYDRTFSYSDRGELIGHIADGVVILHDKAHQAMANYGQRMPGAFITVLQHIILSHHGLPEYGAAKVPATPEAILVSQLDDLDAKTEIGLRAAKRDAETAGLGGNFTERQWALGTKLYRPDPLADAR